MKKYITYLVLLFSVLMISCNSTPEIDHTSMLDGKLISDPSIYQPTKYLISAQFPHPTELQKNMPVVIAAHGYTATTFEWDELKIYANTRGAILVSQVLLGGHGRTYEAFKASTWKD